MSLSKLKPLKAKPSEWPHENLINGSNRPCSQCKFPLVIIEKECPVCGNRDLGMGTTEDQRGLNLMFSYNCELCGRALYSERKLD